jgi:ribosomal-protein-alanine N-acetyltransferase
MNLKQRLQRALKQEKGIRLSAADVQGLSSFLDLGFPEKRKRWSKPSGIKLTPFAPNQSGHVRWMIRRDMPMVLAIDRAVNHIHWTEETYFDLLRRKHVIGMVVEVFDEKLKETKVVGSMVYELRSDCIVLQRIGVLPRYQRKSLGSMMVHALIRKLSSGRRNRITTSVDKDDWAALAFFKTAGFKVTKSAGLGVTVVYRLRGDHWSAEPSEASSRSVADLWMNEDDEEQTDDECNF